MISTPRRSSSTTSTSYHGVKHRRARAADLRRSRDPRRGRAGAPVAARPARQGDRARPARQRRRPRHRGAAGREHVHRARRDRHHARAGRADRDDLRDRASDRAASCRWRCSSTPTPPRRPRSSTGALQDHHRAIVVGTRTYGKGVFQEIIAALQRRSDRRSPSASTTSRTARTSADGGLQARRRHQAERAGRAARRPPRPIRSCRRRCGPRRQGSLSAGAPRLPRRARTPRPVRRRARAVRARGAGAPPRAS